MMRYDAWPDNQRFPPEEFVHWIDKMKLKVKPTKRLSFDGLQMP